MPNTVQVISQGQNIITYKYSCSQCMFLKVHGVSEEFRQSSTRGELSEWEKPKEKMDKPMTVM